MNELGTTEVMNKIMITEMDRDLWDKIWEANLNFQFERRAHPHWHPDKQGKKLLFDTISNMSDSSLMIIYDNRHNLLKESKLKYIKHTCEQIPGLRSCADEVVEVFGELMDILMTTPLTRKEILESCDRINKFRLSRDIHKRICNLLDHCNAMELSDIIRKEYGDRFCCYPA